MKFVNIVLQFNTHQLTSQILYNFYSPLNGRRKEKEEKLN